MNLDPLSSRAAQLRTETEMLVKALAVAENAIRSIGLGVSAMVVMRPTNKKLTYMKLNGAWGLFVNHESHWTPIGKLPPQVQVAAVEHLEALVHQLVEEADRELGRVKEAIRKAQAFVDTVRASQK